jgi:hypothetical protein
MPVVRDGGGPGQEAVPSSQRWPRMENWRMTNNYNTTFGTWFPRAFGESGGISNTMFIEHDARLVLQETIGNLAVSGK